MLPEDTRDRMQDPRAVRDLEGEVVRRLEVVDRPDAGAAQGDAAPGPSGGEVVGGVQQVSENGAGRRHSAGPAAEEHQLTDGITFDEDGVERIPDGRKGMGDRHHGGMNPNGDGLGAGLIACGHPRCARSRRAV